MSSLVLARKHRPKNFAQMVGQGHVVQALANALAGNRLHHAYLFTGTRGVGKTTVSRILAKSLNCVGPDGTGGITAEPCGVCAHCRDIDAGRHVDYVELDAASNRGVDEISQLLDQAVYKPVTGRFKVYMIDEVHMMTTHAFNAMLKTLEEPPDYLKFVLATTDPQKVPVTVLSRCLQFNLRPMAPETVLQHLTHVLAEEGIEAERGALRLLARAARGSMRDGLSLTDQAIAFGAGTLTEAGVRQMLGAVAEAHVHAIVRALAAGDGAALVAQVDVLRTEGLSAEGTLEELAQLAQRMALAQALPEAIDADAPDRDAVLELAQSLPADETQLLYSLAIHGRAELALAPDEYGGLTMVLLRALAFRPAGGAPKQPARPAAAAPRAQPQPATSAALKATPPPMVNARPTPAAVPVVREPHPAKPLVASPPAAPATTSVPPWEDIPPWVEDVPPADEAVVLAPVVAHAAAPSPAAIAVAASFDDPLCARWTALMQQLVERQAVVGLTRELGWQAQCLAFDDASIRLRVERETLRLGEHPKKLQAAVSEVLGRAITIDCEGGTVADSPQKRDAAERARRQQAAEASVHADPLVRKLMQQFRSARIVPGSIQPR